MKLLITTHAQKELDRIPDKLAQQIVKELLGLAHDPYPANSKKLRGYDNYRLRIGSFRAIYTINTKAQEITILRVADRKDIYRSSHKL